MPASLPPHRLDRGRAVLALLVVVVLAGGPAAAGADARPSAAATAARPPSPGAYATNATPAPAEPAFGNDSVVEHRGDVVAFELLTANVTNATLHVSPDGSNASDYEAEVAVRDADGDGRVTVLFNSYLAGRDGSTAFRAAGEDLVVASSSTTIDGLLAAGSYALAVGPSDDLENVTDETTLRLRPRSLEALEFMVSVNGTATLRDPSDARAATRSGRLEAVLAFARSDTVVLALHATGLEGALAAADGDDATDRFFAMDGRAISGVLLERDRTVGTMEDPSRVPLDDPGATRVLPDPRNDTYYLVVSVPADVDEHGGRFGDLDTGDLFRGNVTLPGTSRLADERETVRTREVEFVSRSATVSGDPAVYVAPASNQTVRGDAILAPGRTVTVVVRSETGDYGPFVQRSTVTDERDRNHEFRATFDFAEVPVGTEFTVDVRFRNRSLLEEPHQLVVRRQRARLSLAEPPSVVESTLEVDVTLGHGGYVVAYRGSTDGERLGASDYLPPGTYQDRTVDLRRAPQAGDRVVVVAYRDVDGRRSFDEAADEPYVRDGSPVTAVGYVGASPTPTPSSTPTTTATLSGTQTGTPPTSPTRGSPGPTTTNAPGPGLVGALLALAVALLLVRPRSP